MKILRNKKFTRTVAGVFAGTMLLVTVTQAATITKKIDATFRNIKIYYNNQLKPMSEEPFIYNNRTYLPAGLVAEALDKNVVWDPLNNSIYITDKGTSPSTTIQQLQQEISSKNFEITKLNAEKTVLENKIKELEKNGAGSTTGDLKNIQVILEDRFDYDYSIDWKFKLTETSSRINVEVSFDSKSDGTRWDKLKKSEKDTFFRDICKEIRVDFKDVLINGKVIDSRTDNTVGTFSYSKSNSFSYTDESSYSLSELGKDLYRNSKKINSNLLIDEIKLSGNDDNIVFEIIVTLDSRSLRDEWDTIVEKESTDRVVRDLMNYLEEEIKRDYRYATVEGYIKDYNYSYNTLATYENGRVKLYESR